MVIKQVRKSAHPQEVDIGRYLTSPPLSNDPRNHCCPLLDVLQDPHDSDMQLVVLPFLKRYNEPKFATIGEAVEFFRQALEVCVDATNFMQRLIEMTSGSALHARTAYCASVRALFSSVGSVAANQADICFPEIA